MPANFLIKGEHSNLKVITPKHFRQNPMHATHDKITKKSCIAYKM